MTILAFILACCVLLSPSRDHSKLVLAIASRVEQEAPIFKGDENRQRTAAFLVAVAFREGSLRESVVGDHGHSFCTFQIHDSSGGTADLNEDLDACIEKAFSMLRQSARVCPAHPLAWYASGPGGCENERAQKISRDRMNLAAWLVRKMQ